ncbi:MAG: nitrate- and nitrite sensing domain-containing protein, partial [Actinomycetota bacterium]
MFDRFGIRSRVLALALVPLIVVVGFGAIELQDRQATASDASALAGDVEFGVIATDLVHELQRERGLSSGFVGDPSASIDQVAAQRTAADAARARFDAAFEGLDADFQAQLAVVVVNLDELAEHRVLVDARAISIGETLAPYTEVIGQLLDGLTTLDFSIDDAELVQQAVALRNLSRGKELTGLERGFMNGVVGRGAFADAGEVADYLRIQSDSFVYLDTFDQNATAEQVAAFESRLAEVGPASADLRATLRATPVGTPIPFGADVWWETMTERIDVMRQSEVELSASVVAIADGIAADGSAALTTFVITGLGLAIGLALLAFVIARSISAPVRRLTKDARRVADVDLPDVVARIAAGEDAELEATEHGAGPAEIGQLVESMDTLRDTAATLASEQATMRRNVGELFISLGRRNQNLLTRQLDFIDHLEQEEQDPEVLDNLYRLDHLSTRIRRNAESLLVLAGAESPRPWTTPVEMGDVIRAAMAETEDYSRVDLRTPEAVMLTGGVVSDTTHLLAELLENATRFSPPTSMVTVAGRAQAEGFVIAVADEGIGLAPDQIADLNDLLATPADTLDLADTGKLGLQVVARLAKRHGITVDLYPNGVAGLTARVVIPSSLIVAAPAPPVEPPPAPPVADPAPAI